MILEAVTVCYNYSDFLEHTLPENLQHVDRMVVVTHPSDQKTKDLCQRYGVDCIETEVFHDGGDKLNKGRAINLGLSHLKHDGWLLHLDADILLPHRFRNMVAHAGIQEGNIYGADRLNCKSYDHWEKHKHKISPQHQWRYMVTPPEEFPIGSRLLHQEYGYCPIGYFQLWHSRDKRRYPIHTGSAEHSDVLFAVQWSRNQRLLLPELFCFHLESERGFGMNWQGRKSKPFGPCHPKHHHQHSHHEPKPYCGWKVKEHKK